MRFVALAILAFCCLQNAAAEGRLDSYPAFASKYVAARDVTVWTPEGYDPKGPPLAVLYMHDGENLYEPSHSLSHADWEMDKTVSRLIREKRIPPVIIVGMASTALRGREYLPQKIADALPADIRAKIYASWGGAPVSDDYLRFVVEEVKPFVDAHYNTRRDAAHTFIMGSSMGGLISFYAMAEHPDVFGGAACLSIHWLLGFPSADIAQFDPQAFPNQVTAAFDAYLAKSNLPPETHRLWIDRGDQTLDQYYAPFPPLFETMMAHRGWAKPAQFQSRFYPGEAHSEQAWAKRVADPLVFLLGDLKP